MIRDVQIHLNQLLIILCQKMTSGFENVCIVALFFLKKSVLIHTIRCSRCRVYETKQNSHITWKTTLPRVLTGAKRQAIDQILVSNHMHLDKHQPLQRV